MCLFSYQSPFLSLHIEQIQLCMTFVQSSHTNSQIDMKKHLKYITSKDFQWT